MTTNTFVVLVCACVGVALGGRLPPASDDGFLWVQATGDQALGQLGWTRVAHGQIAVPHSRPFQAAIVVQGQNQGGLCTGALISPTKVITAASMLSRFVLTSLEITLGAHFLPLNEPNTVTQVVDPSAVLLHPQFFHYDNNLAIITLPDPVAETDTIRVVRRLTSVYPDIVGMQLTFSGWGGTEHAPSIPSTQLRQMTSSVLVDSRCPFPMGPGVFCVSGASGGLCAGDGGAPGTAVIGGEVVLISVTNFAHAAGCTAGMEIAHTRLDYSLDWINANL